MPAKSLRPGDFEDREELEDLLSEQIADKNPRAARVHILVPQRGDKRALIDLAGNNAKQSYDQRFRVLKPNAEAIQEELQDALSFPNCRSASSASTSPTFRARRRSLPWWSGKTAR